MAVRPMKVWNAATSTWDDVAVSQRGDVVNKTDFAAKGDIIAGTGASAYDNLPAGNNGEVLTADSTTASGLRWQPVYNAGRNRIINGGFDVWQRGTSFSNPTVNQYLADRWYLAFDGSGSTRTVSQQTFTAGTDPIDTRQGRFFCRIDTSVAGSGGTYLSFPQRIEDVRTFAGQTVTVSFWAKAASSTTLPSVELKQNFGTGGSPSSTVTISMATNVAVTTSWQRFSYTATLPNLSGKTFGTDNNSWLGLIFALPLNATFTLDLWGVQLEAGNVATRFEEEPFEATLRKCQRYYQKSYALATAPGTATETGAVNLVTPSAGTGAMYTQVIFPTRMRSAPTITFYDGTGASGKVFKGANGKTAAARNASETGFGGGTEDATSASYLVFQYTAEIEL